MSKLNVGKSFDELENLAHGGNNSKGIMKKMRHFRGVYFVCGVRSFASQNGKNAKQMVSSEILLNFVMVYTTFAYRD